MGPAFLVPNIHANPRPQVSLETSAPEALGAVVEQAPLNTSRTPKSPGNTNLVAAPQQQLYKIQGIFPNLCYFSHTEFRPLCYTQITIRVLTLQYPSLSSQALEDSNTNLLCPCPLGGLAGFSGSYFVLH